MADSKVGALCGGFLPMLGSLLQLLAAAASSQSQVTESRGMTMPRRELCAGSRGDWADRRVTVTGELSLHLGDL